MCPNGFRFYRELQMQSVFNGLTTAAPQSFALTPNPNRVGIVWGFNAGTVRVILPSSFTLARVRDCSVGNPANHNWLWVSDIGPLMFGAFTIEVSDLNTVFRLDEIWLNPDFK